MATATRLPETKPGEHLQRWPGTSRRFRYRGFKLQLDTDGWYAECGPDVGGAYDTLEEAMRDVDKFHDDNNDQ